MKTTATKTVLDKGGNPRVFTVRTDDGKDGDLLDAGQMRRFACDTLMQLYREGGNAPREYLQTTGGYPDFALEYRLRLRKSFTVARVASLEVVPEVDASGALRLYHKYGTFPKLAMVELDCIETGSSEVMHEGDHCTVRLRYVSLADDNTASPYEGPAKSQAELALLMEECWRKRDSSIIEPYIAADVCYESAWVFDMIVGKQEYLENLRDRFGYMGRHVKLEIEDNPDTGEKQFRTVSSPVNTMTLHTRDGYITAMKMCDRDVHASREYAQYGTKGDFI